MRLAVLAFSRGLSPWCARAVDHYLGRLRRYARVDWELLRPGPYRQGEERARRDEARRLLGRLGPGDRLVVLDERGEALDTRAWQRLVERAPQEGARRLVFAVGGAYGHHASVRERAWKLLSLSPLVLAHEVALVVLLEQLYRVHSLARGEPYHHGD